MYSPSTEKLHPQQGEYHGEEEEEKKKTNDGLHGAHERHHQVPERGPVSGKKEPVQHKNSDRSCCLSHPNPLGDLKDSEKPQRSQHADPKRYSRPEETPDHLKDAPNNDLQTSQRASQTSCILSFTKPADVSVIKCL